MLVWRKPVLRVTYIETHITKVPFFGLSRTTCILHLKSIFVDLNMLYMVFWAIGWFWRNHILIQYGIACYSLVYPIIVWCSLVQFAMALYYLV